MTFRPLSIMAFSIMTFSIMTFSIMTFSIMTFSKMTLSIMTFSIMALNIMTFRIFSIMTFRIFSIMTLRIMILNLKGLVVTLTINVTEHNNALHYSECHYAECLILFIVMLSVVMLNVVILSVVAPRVRPKGLHIHWVRVKCSTLAKPTLRCGDKHSSLLLPEFIDEEKKFFKISISFKKDTMMERVFRRLHLASS
jgi:hypothetical protein